MATLTDHAERWRTWAETTSQTIHTTAVGAPKMGGQQWDALLEQAGVQPLSAEQRAELADKGPPRRSGPPPIEVRRALEAMAARVAQGCRALEEQASARGEDLDERLDRIRYAASTMVEHGLRAYLAAVRPRISTSSIFANAAATKKRHVDTSTGPTIQSETCGCCGAPVSVQTRGRICVYCGTPL